MERSAVLVKMTPSARSVARNLYSSPITKQREDMTSDFGDLFWLPTHKTREMQCFQTIIKILLPGNLKKKFSVYKAMPIGLHI